jgi:CheY-like chemotaxis protein
MNTIKLTLEYTRQLNVLYVEDDIILIKSTTELFENYFKSVHIAENGELGLEKYKDFKEMNGHYYDLILTDINMPRMNGLEMSEQILEINPLQAIIVITAHNESELLLKAIELGVDGFVTKPMENDKLVKVLYKTAQSISDHKFVETHVAQMEELTLQLDTQNQELIKKNEELEKSFRMLNTVVTKESMLKTASPTKKKPAIDHHIIHQVQDLVNNDLYELKEILIEIDVGVIKMINNLDAITKDELVSMAELFLKYASVLSYYSFFVELSSAMSKFAHTMQTEELPHNEESVKNIFMILESFVYVLGRWHEDIASDEEHKVNQFDASIISDIHTITNMWIQKDESVSEEGVDNIFDF